VLTGCVVRGPLDPPVFPYTTLFRSTIIQTPGHTPGHTVLLVRLPNAGPVLLTGDMFHLAESRERHLVPSFNTDREQTIASQATRSEEHTSELQSRENLVCRLLPEKR